LLLYCWCLCCCVVVFFGFVVVAAVVVFVGAAVLYLFVLPLCCVRCCCACVHCSRWKSSYLGTITKNVDSFAIALVILEPPFKSFTVLELALNIICKGSWTKQNKTKQTQSPCVALGKQQIKQCLKTHYEEKERSIYNSAYIIQ